MLLIELLIPIYAFLPVKEERLLPKLVLKVHKEETPYEDSAPSSDEHKREKHKKKKKKEKKHKHKHDEVSKVILVLF